MPLSVIIYAWRAGMKIGIMTIGRARVINPGALGGRRRQSRSFCILDLTTGEIRFVELR
jgi:predicted phosphodiesterase